MNRLLTITLFLLFPLLASATSIFDLIHQEDPYAASVAALALPVDSIMARSADEQDATFTFTGADGTIYIWKLKVSTRGKFRRARCEMPPIKFNFSKKDLRAAGLSEFDKYKLVLPCFENPQAEELVLKEYLAYRAYEMLTPFSYRTQLLKLSIKDSNGGPDHVISAFLIEATDEMAARNGGVEYEKVLGNAAEFYDEEAEATHALFQYLVGNGDWSLVLGRNVKVIEVGDRHIPVGYDFDFTGWVGAPYATANSNVGQKSIYERVYLGYSQSDEVIDEVVRKFQENRRDVLKLIDNSELTADAKSSTQRFAARFFSRLNRLKTDNELTKYDQLRGETAMYIPMGEEIDSFRSMGR